MNSTAVLFAVFLLFAAVEGSPLYNKGRCRCIGSSADFIHLKRIEKFEVIPASPMCQQIEIVVTMKDTAEERCMNPKSKQAQNIISNLLKKRSSQK
ncbi:C-X-C motif chemokine 10-like [Huso huso]|uniref:C-X-C motif chemokine 10-like n=1 Tax=Huso huso TaxID=61971 RepID=A0ABR1A627_HUSHU|nr:C-X-C motif chemokine 10-like [Acipenser ruthenus]XP_034781084.1 C-X-C motif chemokine 10-like [Acipenser ruthenus]